MDASTAAPDATPSTKLDAKTRLALFAMGLAVFVVANDITSLSVALPEVERDLGVGVGSVQWVANAYTLAFGVLIVTGGRLGDVFGRRRAFLVGIAIFATFIALAAVADSVGLLIAARTLMAVGAALMWPAVVGITFSVLPAARAGLAGALLLGVSGIGNGLGPLIGGFLTDEASWRWILVLNLPIALAATLAVRASIPKDTGQETHERLDGRGVAAMSIGLVGVLVALDQSADWGWGDPRTLGLLAVGIAGLVALPLIERAAGDRALIPRAVMGNRTFALACVTTLLASGTWFAVLLYAPQYMQKALGFSAFESGLGFLPLMAVFTAASFAAGPLYNKLGGRALLPIGTVCIAIGVFLLSLLQADGSYAAMIPALVVLGLGVGLFYATLTTVAMTALDAQHAGVGGGLLFMFQLVGGAIGVVLTTTVLQAVADGDQGPADPAPYAGKALDAFVDGLHAGLRVDAALALAATVVSFAVVSRRRSSGSPAPDAPAS